MADYSYTAVDGYGQRVKGTAAAATEDQLASVLASRGEHLVEARARDQVTRWSDIRILERANRRDVIVFTSQLATVTGAGVPLADGLLQIETLITKPAMKKVVAGVRNGIESGLSLSDSLGRYPQAFSELYVNIVKAGEATGKANRALADLVIQLEWQEDLRNKIRDALTYPIIVIVLMTIAVSVLVGFTVPRIAQVYQSLSATLQLPLPTRIIVGVASFVRFNALPILAAIVAVGIYLRLQWATLDGRARLQGLLLRVPVAGDLMRKVAFSRFAHFFATLHGAGYEVAPSMSLIERLIGNEYLARRFHRAVDRVMAGSSLTAALQAVGEFPAIVIQMISLGERTGRMDRLLEDVRRYYDKEVDRGVHRMITVAGPVMLLVLAGIFVTMVVAFYLPLFRILTAVQTQTGIGAP